MKFVAVIIAIALLWNGGQGVYTGLKNKTPVETTCAEYAKSRPEGSWVKVSECFMDFGEAGQRGDSTASELFIPLRPASEGEEGASTQRPSIVLVSKDAKLLGFYNGMSRLGDDDSEGASKLIAANLDIVGATEFGGLVQFGLELSDDERKQMSALTQLQDDFVMLEHNARPNLSFSLLILGGGILLSGIFVALFLRGRGRGRRREAVTVAPLTNEQFIDVK